MHTGRKLKISSLVSRKTASNGEHPHLSCPSTTNKSPGTSLYYQTCLTRRTPGSQYFTVKEKEKSNIKVSETIKPTSQGKYTVKFRIRNGVYKLFMPLAQTLKDNMKQTKCSNNSWDIIIRQAFKMWGGEVQC